MRRQGWRAAQHGAARPPRALQVRDRELKGLLGDARFFSITYRLFKLPEAMETLCEDYGQACKYLVSVTKRGKVAAARRRNPARRCAAAAAAHASAPVPPAKPGARPPPLALPAAPDRPQGTIPGHKHSYALDDHHTFQTGKWYEVCGNTGEPRGGADPLMRLGRRRARLALRFLPGLLLSTSTCMLAGVVVGRAGGAGFSGSGEAGVHGPPRGPLHVPPGSANAAGQCRASIRPACMCRLAAPIQPGSAASPCGPRWLCRSRSTEATHLWHAR